MAAGRASKNALCCKPDQRKLCLNGWVFLRFSLKAEKTQHSIVRLLINDSDHLPDAYQ